MLKYIKLNPPDLVIKLAVSPHIAQQRKPGEISVNDSLRMAQQFKDLGMTDQRLL